MTVATFFATLNQEIVDHKELFTVLAVPFLTWVVTSSTNRSAEKRALEERRVERELTRQVKLAEFRLSWIETLRHEIAEFCRLLSEEGTIYDQKLSYTASKLQTLMNPEDPDYDSFVAIQIELIKSKEAGEIPDAYKLTNIGQKILKREWERLKKDLDNLEGTPTK